MITCKTWFELCWVAFFNLHMPFFTPAPAWLKAICYFARNRRRNLSECCRLLYNMNEQDSKSTITSSFHNPVPKILARDLPNLRWYHFELLFLLQSLEPPIRVITQIKEHEKEKEKYFEVGCRQSPSVDPKYR